MKLVIIGPPGSGKTTQSLLLSKRLKLKFVDAGALLRKEARKKTERGKLVHKIISKGKLAPIWITNSLVKQETEKSKKFIINGYPRSLGQATFLYKHIKIDLILNFKVPEKIILKRLSARRFCPKCGKMYNLLSIPPKKDELCDKCKVKLKKRDDDNPKAIKQRLKIYHQNHQRILKYLKKRFKVIDVNLDDLDIEESFQEILNTISLHLRRRH